MAVFVVFLRTKSHEWVSKAQKAVEDTYKCTFTKRGKETKNCIQDIAHYQFNNTKLQKLRRHMKTKFSKQLLQKDIDIDSIDMTGFQGKRAVPSPMKVLGIEFTLVDFVDDDDVAVGEAFNGPVAQALSMNWSKEKILERVEEAIDRVSNVKRSKKKVRTIFLVSPVH